MTNRQGGLWYHSGALFITDTLDNQSGNELFRSTFPNNAPISPGKVQLWGGYQWITGTDPIHFDTLELRGLSSKHLAQSAYVRHWLDLGNHMFSTHAETLYHRHPAPNSIVRGTGFMQSDLGGALQRSCQGGQAYSFPLGDSMPALRYRPLLLTPDQAGLYNARFANTDPTNEAYPRSNHHPALCLVNPDYFHHLSGPTRAKVAISYDPNSDLPYDQMAHWNGTRWDSIGGQQVAGVPLSLVEEGGLVLSPTPFALAIRRPAVAIQPTGPVDLCPGDSVRLSVLQPNPQWTYTWTNGQVGPQTWVYGPGVYAVTASIGGVPSCTAHAQVEVRVLPAPFIDIQPSSPQGICPDRSLLLTATSPAQTYQWFFNGDTVRGATGPRLLATAAGLYTVQAVQACGLAESEPFLLFHHSPPTAFFVSTPSDSVELGQPVLFVDSSRGGRAYQWILGGDTLPGSPTLTHAFGQEGFHTITLIAQSAEGCRDTFTRSVYVKPFSGVYVPTAFTPNGDGINDIFLIVAPPLTSSRLHIYDRWGILLREILSQPPTWDGTTSDGVLVPEGVYAFTWEGRLYSGQTIARSGTITVLR
jgi:gliding motility-associated-like protein